MVLHPVRGRADVALHPHIRQENDGGRCDGILNARLRMLGGSGGVKGVGWLGQRTIHTMYTLMLNEFRPDLGTTWTGWCVPMRVVWFQLGTRGYHEDGFLSSVGLSEPSTSSTPPLVVVVGGRKGDPAPRSVWFRDNTTTCRQAPAWGICTCTPSASARRRLHSPKASAGHGMTGDNR